MRYAVSLLSTLVVVACLLTGGCGGGGGVGGGTSVATGGLSAFVFANAAHQVLLAPSNTAPPGFTIAPGAAISIGGATAATADTNGHFNIGHAPTGLSKLHVAVNSGAAGDFPVTIFGGVTAILGDPAVSRATAIVAAKAAATAAFPAATVQIMGPQEPLPAGVTLAPAIPRLDLTDDPASLIVPATPQWFFILDPTPSEPFQHTVKFVTVDAVSGHVSATDQQSWPKVNGRNYYGDPTVNLSSADLIQSAPAGKSQQQVQAVTRAHSATREADPTGNTFALFVNGLPGTIDPAATGLIGHCGVQAAMDTRTVSSLVHPKPADDAVTAFNALVQEAKAGDTLYVHIAAHGSLGSDPKTGLQAYGVWLPNNLSDGSDAKGQYLVPQELNFSQFKGCQIIVVASTCFSGSWIPAMKSQLKPLLGTEAVVITASDSVHVANGSLSSSSGFLGPSFPHDLLVRADVKSFSTGLQGLEDAYNEELANETGGLIKSENPLIFHRVPAPSEPHCGKVTLDPHAASTSSGGTVGLTVTQPDPTTGTFTYHWRTTGSQGILQDPKGHSGKDFDSTSPTASYVANSSVTAGATDTVTVEAFQVPQGGVGQKTSLGTDKCVITMSQFAPCGTPPPPTPAQGPGVVPSGVGNPSMTLDKTNYKAGDTLTVTLHIAAGNSSEGSWVIAIGGGEGFIQAIGTVIGVDGKPVSGGGVETPGQLVQHPGAAETHVVTFKLNTPMDTNGNPASACSAGIVNGRLVGPFLIAQIFGNDGQLNSFSFFNATP